MKIVDILEVTKPIKSNIRNAYIDFSKMTLSLVALPGLVASGVGALVFVGLGTFLGLTFAVLNSVVGPKRKPRWEMQADPYECGLPSDVKKNFRFGISFYLIAMLFILFDIEVIFLFPVAIQLKAFGTFALVEISVFIALLFVAFVYVWRRGALEWK